MNRREAREYSFKTLFQLDINNEHLNDYKSDYDYVTRVINGVKKYKEELDDTISNHLINWTINRIATVDKTILRLAIYEIKYMDDIPKSVSINEAVDLAHKYGDEKSAKFINGILSNITN